MNVDLYKSNISAAQKRYLAKDQFKASHSNKFIGRGNGATGQYLKLCADAGYPVNCGTYAKEDIVFISANGMRRGRISPDLAEIKKACDAGARLLTDARCRRPEGGNRYNIGEQEVANFLRTQGYVETRVSRDDVCLWVKGE